jgi:hypothetical protein
LSKHFSGELAALVLDRAVMYGTSAKLAIGSMSYVASKTVLLHGQYHGGASLSPLGRFLLIRWQ